jgi:hypothetical protein
MGSSTGDQLLYAGEVRGGFSEAEARDLRERLDPFIRKDAPLSEPVNKPKATWVEPVVEAEVRPPPTGPMAAGRSALAQVPYGGAHEAVPGVRPRSRPPQKPAREYRVYPALIERCAELEPVSTAVAHPCDESSLTAAIEAAEADLIRPVLVGPENKIRSVAEQFGLDIRPKIPSTIDAAALCKMAERGQITGALLDGPLAFDNSISKEAAGNVTVVGTKADVSFSDVLDNLSMAASASA